MAITKNNKYLGKTGLIEFVNLMYAEFQKKQDWLQFPEIPNTANYVGKVIQYTGTTNDNYTKGHFYYSNGVSWTEVDVGGASFEIVAALPAWSSAEADTIYFVPTERGTLTGYVKNKDEEGKFYDIGAIATATIKKYIDTEHYDPDATYPENGEEFSFDGLEIESFTDDEIKTLYAEV